MITNCEKAKQVAFYASGLHPEEPWKLLFLRQGICGIPAIYVQRIQTETLKLASFNRVLFMHLACFHNQTSHLQPAPALLNI